MFGEQRILVFASCWCDSHRLWKWRAKSSLPFNSWEFFRWGNHTLWTLIWWRWRHRGELSDVFSKWRRGGWWKSLLETPWGLLGRVVTSFTQWMLLELTGNTQGLLQLGIDLLDPNNFRNSSFEIAATNTVSSHGWAFSISWGSSPSEPSFSSGFSFRLRLTRLHRVPSRWPAAVAAELGGYFSISYRDMRGRFTPSRNSYMKEATVGLQKDPW